MPVSYTHLAVYKRQAVARLRGMTGLDSGAWRIIVLQRTYSTQEQIGVYKDTL